jgi:hypothetical protein
MDGECVRRRNSAKQWRYFDAQTKARWRCTSGAAPLGSVSSKRGKFQGENTKTDGAAKPVLPTDSNDSTSERALSMLQVRAREFAPLTFFHA